MCSPFVSDFVGACFEDKLFMFVFLCLFKFDGIQQFRIKINHFESDFKHFDAKAMFTKSYLFKENEIYKIISEIN